MKKRATPSVAQGKGFLEEKKGTKRLRPSSTVGAPPRNDYKGFSLQGKDQQQHVQEIPVESPFVSPQDFFAKYVATRTPCIIDGLPATMNTAITPAILKEHAGKELVQVEKRYSREELFGQNRTKARQFITTVSKFVDRLLSSNDDGDLLYLSTQQRQQLDENEDDVSSPFGVPCQQLLEKGFLQKSVPWAGNLILQSCNLWMGSSVEGSCSGLHHDYHDNFYVLFQGRKQFRLFSPDMAETMHTHGTVECIHPNGLISHVGNELRADGVSQELLEEQEDEDENDEEEEEEEELVLGKGFDYKSDSEEDVDFDEAMFQDDNDLKDDYDDAVGDDDDNDDSGEEESAKGRATTTNNEQAKEKETDHDARPDSFSRIDLTRPKNELQRDFPKFPDSLECIVELKAGQVLYLPASWFHCVTSFAECIKADPDECTSKCAKPTHTAINYWYHPPDNLKRYDDPYQGHFWDNKNK